MIKEKISNLSQQKILVVGDAMLDRYWHGIVERISPEAPVPVLKVTQQEDRLGGAGNVAFNVAKLGAQVSLLSVLGDDDGARNMSQLLESGSINSLVEIDSEFQTIVKLRLIGHAQQLLRVDFENKPNSALIALFLEKFKREIPKYNLVIFSDYNKGSLVNVGEMISLANNLQIPVLVDPKGSDYARYKGADIITPNRSELAQVVGNWESEADLFDRVQKLRNDFSIKSVLLTRSEQGMTLFYGENKVVNFSTKAREVFDVTGAGDTVIATLAAMLTINVDLEDAVQWANHAAGIVVSKFGTSFVTVEEIFG